MLDVIKQRVSLALVVFIGLLALTTGQTNSACAATRHTIQNHHTAISVDGASGIVTSWTIQGGSLTEKHQLVSLDNTQLKLQGDVAGKSIADWVDLANGWRIVSAEDEFVALQLAGEGLPFVLEQRWTLRETLWESQLKITLHALEDIGIANFGILLGPGIGDEPVAGLGVADGLYSFTEVVYQQSGNVEQVRMQAAGDQHHWSEAAGLDWIGLHSRYFAVVLRPDNDESRFSAAIARSPSQPAYYPAAPSFETSLLVELQVEDLHQGQSAREFSWQLFAGGKSYEALTQNDLQAVLFSKLWQWMRLLTIGIMQVLYAVQSVVVNWGIAIIFLAIFVRLVIHPIAKRAMASQKRFAALQEIIQPEIREIKRKYKGGEQSERILHVYERNKVSPLAGLKPLLIVAIQIPVFIALFHLLGQAFELRETSFLWMKSLAEPDRLFSFGVNLPFFGSYFNLLPVLMSLTTMLSIKLSPTPASDSKEKSTQTLMLTLMTLGFFLLFYSFPSGMVLYWTMANVLHLGHSLYVKYIT